MSLLSALDSTSANAIAVGRNGATNPVFKVDCSVSSAATGLTIIGRAATAGVDLTVISSGTNENLAINAKGSGTVTINGTATGAIALGTATGVTGALTGTSTSASALAVGANGATNPVLQVDANTASVATGLKVTGAAAAAGLALAVVSSGTNENLTIDAKGSGTISLNATGTGAITLARAASCSSTLAVTGNFAVNTNKFTVTAASGNTLVAGTLSVTGDVAVNTDKFTVAAASGNTLVAGTLDVTGAAVLASTLGVTGNVAVATNKFTVTAASGNTAVAGTLAVTGLTTLTGGLKGGVQDLNAAGAVNVTTLTTKWGTTGANDAGTLADGAEGQLKFIVMDADGGDGILTPTNLADGTTITFNDVGDSVLLQFLNADWHVIVNKGCTVA